MSPSYQPKTYNVSRRLSASSVSQKFNITWAGRVSSTAFIADTISPNELFVDACHRLLHCRRSSTRRGADRDCSVRHRTRYLPNTGPRPRLRACFHLRHRGRQLSGDRDTDVRDDSADEGHEHRDCRRICSRDVQRTQRKRSVHGQHVEGLKQRRGGQHRAKHYCTVCCSRWCFRVLPVALIVDDAFSCARTHMYTLLRSGHV